MAGTGPTFGVPNAGAAATAGAPNMLVTLLTALGQIPQLEQQKKENALKLQERKAQMQQQQAYTQMEQQRVQMQQQMMPYQIQSEQQKVTEAQRAAAQNQMQMLGQHVLAGNVELNDPALINTAQQAAQTLGMPSPVKNGTIDKEYFMRAPDGKDPQFLSVLSATKPNTPGRKNALNALGYKATPEAMAAEQFFTPKDTAALVRAQAAIASVVQRGIHYDNMDGAARMRIENQRLINIAKIGQLGALTDKERADATLAITRAQNDSARTKDADVNARAHMMQAQASMMRAAQAAQSAKSTPAQHQAMAMYQGALTDVKRLQDDVENFKAQVKQNTLDGVDDATLQQHTAQLQGYQAALEKAQQRAKEIGAALSQNPGMSAEVKAASGALGVTITDVKKPGVKSSAAQPIEVRTINGVKWGRFADGTFRQIP